MSTNSFPALRVPIIDPKTGMMDWAWTQWFVDAQNRLQNGLDQLGQFKGNISDNTLVVGRTEGIGTTLQHISDTGVMEPAGMTAATSTAQGAVQLPPEASGNILGTAALKDATNFDAAGDATRALASAKSYTDQSSAAVLAEAKTFLNGTAYRWSNIFVGG